LIAQNRFCYYNYLLPISHQLISWHSFVIFDVAILMNAEQMLNKLIKTITFKKLSTVAKTSSKTPTNLSFRGELLLNNRRRAYRFTRRSITNKR